MVLKCPNCNGFLEYDPITSLMICKYCSSSFDVSELDMSGAGAEENGGGSYDGSQNGNGWDGGSGPDSSYGGSYSAGPGSAYDSGGAEETMDTKIYTCTSCGAELMINDVETATFCAYCGQPTIVFSRISKMRKPKYILPFTITRERAHEIIRAKFQSGKYIPASIRDFKPEIIRGIYIPFLLYDVNYYDRQLIKSTHKSGKHSYTYYYYREASHNFSNITVDSSKNFNDESSQRLEPYDLNNMKPFQAAYLSGYYADCMDDDKGKMDWTAIERSKKLFDEAVLKTVSGSSKAIIDNNPTTEITNAEYVMLPVWFVVFHAQDHAYTIMVNGQTGKMVGAVPCDMGTVRANLALYCTVCSAVGAFVMGFLCHNSTIVSDGGSIIVWAVMILSLLIFYIRRHYKAYQKSQNLTRSGQIRHLASDRQREQ